MGMHTSGSIQECQYLNLSQNYVPRFLKNEVETENEEFLPIQNNECGLELTFDRRQRIVKNAGGV